MKTTIAILFTLLYGVALIRPAFPLIEYYAKMEVYLEKCANKKRPELHCNGQCILMQKLKGMNETSQDSPTPPAPVKINFEDYPIGFVDESTAVKSLGPNTLNGFSTVPWPMFSNAYENAIFHPPSLSV